MTISVRRTMLRRAIACLIPIAVAPAAAQTTSFIGNEAAIAPIVRGVPYSADAVTTLTQVLANGTRIERTTIAKFYRDSAGRVRREQTILGLAALNPFSEAQVLITIVDPVAGLTYVLDPEARTARRMGIDPRSLAGAPPPPPPPPPRPAAGIPGAAAPPAPPPPPPRPDEEALGTAVIAGIKVTGRRSRTTIPPGTIGNDQPIQIVDERWESPELRVLVQSRHDDPRTGTVEYQLTNVTRVEPRAELFSIPSDYAIVDGPPPPPPPPPAPPAPQ